MLALALLSACGGPGDAADPRLQQLRDGELPANNLIIYDRGARKTIGLRVLGDSGSFELAGPTVVYVFRSFNPGDAEQMKNSGIEADEHTAYLLPSGASPTLDALQRMQRIGPIDPAMSDEQLAARFRLGAADDRATGKAAAPPPAQPDSEADPGGPAPAAAPGTTVPLEASGEQPDPKPVAPPAPPTRSAGDEQIEELGRRLDEALAGLASDMRDGNDSTASRQSIRDIQLELQALIARREPTGPAAGSAAAGSGVSPTGPFGEPATARCAEYNGLDPSAAATATVNEALTAYAEGLAAEIVEYQACGATAFDRAAYVDHLASYCAANPEKTIRDSVIDYVCEEGG